MDKQENASLAVSRRREWAKLIAFLDSCSDSRWMFRGVGSPHFPLVPAIGRPINGVNVYDADRERTIFYNFRRRARLRVPVQVEHDLEWMAVAQHQGLPTRLLDWTPNPLVATYFAVGAQRITSAPAARLYAVPLRPEMRVTAETDPFALEEVKFFVPPYIGDRLAAQRGCFSIHPQPDQPYRPPRLRTHDIPSAVCAYIQRRLFYFGVDASSVMTDLDGLSAALKWQYESGVAVGRSNY
jgi:hypothetical protein